MAINKLNKNNLYRAMEMWKTLSEFTHIPTASTTTTNIISILNFHALYFGKKWSLTWGQVKMGQVKLTTFLQ